MPVIGLDHVQLAAPGGCEDAARAFYGVALGLPEVPKPPGTAATGGAWFRCGAQEIHVGVASPFVPAVKAHPGLLVNSPAELERIADALAGAGHPVEWDTRIAGVRRCFTRDPWGNRLELRAA